MKVDPTTINGAEPRLTERITTVDAPRPKRPGAMHTAHLLMELSKDSAGIISALETMLAPLLAPGVSSPPMPEVKDDPAESVMVNTQNAAGTLAAWNRKRLEDLIERLRV